MTTRRRPAVGEFISWPCPFAPDGRTVMRVVFAHRNGHHLRDADGFTDQFDSLPPRWRVASEAEIATFLAGAAS